MQLFFCNRRGDENPACIHTANGIIKTKIAKEKYNTKRLGSGLTYASLLIPFLLKYSLFAFLFLISGIWKAPREGYVMAQDINLIESLYDSVAKEYAETFSGEHEKKPKDQEILHRFSLEVGLRKPVWDIGCGPGQTTNFLKNLGIEISGMDLSEKILEQARALHSEIHFRKGNILQLEFETGSIAGRCCCLLRYNSLHKRTGRDSFS